MVASLQIIGSQEEEIRVWIEPFRRREEVRRKPKNKSPSLPRSKYGKNTQHKDPGKHRKRHALKSRNYSSSKSTEQKYYKNQMASDKENSRLPWEQLVI